MIRVNFTEPTNTAWLRWKRDVASALEEMVAKHAVNQAITISESLYKRRKDMIFEAFFRKCAYCECDLGSQHGDVEHYRPKKAVTDINDQPATFVHAGVAQIHPGYFWLAYDWKNLLPACQKCNQQPKRQPDGSLAGKGNRFPIVSAYAYDTVNPVNTNIGTEDPLLLHPCLDQPEDHLTFLETTGGLGWKTLRGEKTIELCGLNSDWLCDRRRAAFLSARTNLIVLVGLLLSGVDASPLIEEVGRIDQGKAAFAFVGRRALKEARMMLKGI